MAMAVGALFVAVAGYDVAAVLVAKVVEAILVGLVMHGAKMRGRIAKSVFLLVQ